MLYLGAAGCSSENSGQSEVRRLSTLMTLFTSVPSCHTMNLASSPCVEMFRKYYAEAQVQAEGPGGTASKLVVERTLQAAKVDYLAVVCAQSVVSTLACASDIDSVPQVTPQYNANALCSTILLVAACRQNTGCSAQLTGCETVWSTGRACLPSTHLRADVHLKWALPGIRDAVHGHERRLSGRALLHHTCPVLVLPLGVLGVIPVQCWQDAHSCAVCPRVLAHLQNINDIAAHIRQNKFDTASAAASLLLNMHTRITVTVTST
jgi:hypothetical protein